MAARQAKTDSPLFVVGTGRCGSTIVESLLAMHPDLAFASSWIDSFPKLPQLAIANRVWNIAWMDRFRESRFVPTPVEPYAAFRRYLANFDSETATPSEIQEVRDRLYPFLRTILVAHGKERFLGKLVGRPVKIALFSAAFERSQFVAVTRGLKPTLCSVMRVPFYQEWGALSQWPWEEIPPEMIEFYQESGEDESVAAAIRLTMNKRALDGQLAALPKERRMLVSYADFVKSPTETIRAVLQYAGLRDEPGYVERIRRRKVYANADSAWRSFFTPTQIGLLDRFESTFGY